MKIKFLLLMLGVVWNCAILFAQQQTVTGKVTDDDGKSLQGVTVMEKGKSNQVITDGSGNYKITVSPRATLIYRYVGMNTVEQAVGSKTNLNVTLSSSSSSIDEVVVTAYGIDRSKKSLGYSTPVVSGDEVSETQREAFFNGLQGRVPGLSINSTSGAPGASAQIVLRGFVSVSGDNSALIVVDGVPIDNSTLNENDLASGSANRALDYSNRGMDLNPEDIESYTIMKGPEATALFGSQGASGAILITTKKAKAGRTAVTYNFSGRMETVNKFPEVQNVYSKGTNGLYDGTSPYSLGPKYKEGVQLYDNIRSFFRTGYNQKHNLSFEGGNEAFTYRWSNEYNDNTGITPNTRYTRISSRLAATAKFGEKLNINTSFSYTNSDNDKARKGADGYMVTLLRFNPMADVRQWIDEKGNRVLHSGTIYSEFDNPFWDVYRNTSFDKVNRMMANSNIMYRPSKWLSVNGILGLDYSFTHGESVYHNQSYLGSGSEGDPTGGQISVYDRTSRILTGSLTARSSHKFDDFSLQGVLGASFNDYNYVTNAQYGKKFFDQDFYSINNTLPETRLSKSTINNYRNVGFFGQAVLGYKTILYLTLSGRLDGSSRLMPNNPFFGYPSGSIAFNFSDIKGFHDMFPFVDEGKLRSSVSLTGKEPWRTYYTKSSFEGQYSTGGGFAYGVNGGNLDLKVERTRDFETGIEFSLFKKRVSFDFTYYTRLSSDQIILPRLSYGTGYILKMLNGGEVKNHGIEIQTMVRPIEKRDFNWDVTFNFTKNRGKVLSLAEELPELYESDTWVLSGLRTSVHPGYSIGALSGTRFKRNANGDVLINTATGLPVTGDGVYYPIGDRIPDFTLGTINKFRYKSISLSFLWDLRVGGDVFNGLENRMFNLGVSAKTLNREEPRVIQGVLQDGLEESANPTINNIAVTPFYNSNYYFTNVEPSMFIERDIYTFRLRDISLAYELPKSLTSRLGKNTSMSVFFTGTDLLLFTNYTGLDPESNLNTPGVGGIGGYGIDYGNMAKPRGFNLGLRLKL
ncbi:SusC/RagA family TonB-linked outer membrane protein [Sphingobacterium spiritivorum]|uniref:SusC/RagA family TonB-linked outer membrane protein n=1 Tax=Sphingobacterium spiritivorum TaxID=258 RepID=UPI003DA385E5